MATGNAKQKTSTQAKAKVGPAGPPPKPPRQKKKRSGRRR
jgi:hypothetical protein